MTSTPTTPDPNEIHAVATGDTYGCVTRKVAAEMIANLDDYRAKHGVVPSYMESANAFGNADPHGRLFRFKDKDINQ